jgi:hypothetical protein
MWKQKVTNFCLTLVNVKKKQKVHWALKFSN